MDKIEYQEIWDLLEELNLKDHYIEITKEFRNMEELSYLKEEYLREIGMRIPERTKLLERIKKSENEKLEEKIQSENENSALPNEVQEQLKNLIAKIGNLEEERNFFRENLISIVGESDKVHFKSTNLIEACTIDLELAKLMLENTIYQREIKNYYQKIFNEACIRGNLEIINLIYKRSNNFIPEFRKLGFLGSGFFFASSRGQEKVVDYLISKGKLF